MKRSLLTALVASFAATLPSSALAHVEVASGVAFAGRTQLVTFGVGHGCEGADTASVRIEIPASVASVRALDSTFGRASVERDASDRVVAVTWEKPEADLLEGDDNYYELTLRIRVPDAPFTRIHFPTYQTCRTPDGATITAEWTAAPGEEGEAAPVLTIVPARSRGWNRYLVPVDVDALDLFFADALIVWKGDAAFSANEETAAQIERTPGVTLLTSLAAGDEIQVKY